MANLRFEVVFDSQFSPTPEKILYLMSPHYCDDRSEDDVLTIEDLKKDLVTNYDLQSNHGIDLYVNDNKLQDRDSVSIIRDNETVVVKRRVIQIKEEEYENCFIFSPKIFF